MTNFRTYNLAVRLYRQCDRIKCKSYLRDQLMRASLSVVLNLSEGSAKFTEKDRKRFYNIAYASCREVKTILGLIDRNAEFQLADQICACLYRLHNPQPHASCHQPSSTH